MEHCRAVVASVEHHGVAEVKGHRGAAAVSIEHHRAVEAEDCHGAAEVEEHCRAALWGGGHGPHHS